MDSIVRRIKDLDQITFQQLCFHVMSERFPSAKVHYPEGAAGDEGVDLFMGDLSQGPTLWQCKAFTVTILGDSQRRQIKESLRDAVKKVQPKIWILCLNMNLDMKGSRWFRRLQESYASLGVTIADPFDAMDMARELMFRRTIRNHFFPNLTLDLQELKSLMKSAAKGMDSVEDEDLEKLATENTEEYLDRLQERDPRFTYEVTFGGDRGPSVFPPAHEPNLVASMTDGRKIIKAYARDLEAVRQDPVSSHFQFNETGGKKLLDFIRTGKKQSLDPGEIRNFTSTFPLLSGMKFVPGSFSMSVQSIPDNRTIPLKLVFSKDGSQTTLDYVEFRKTRSGAEETEITSEGAHPLGLTLVLPLNMASAVKGTISTKLLGRTIREVANTCAALKLLQAGCTLQLISLKSSNSLGTLVANPVTLPFESGFFSFIEDLATIAMTFGVNFSIPSAPELMREDEETFDILRALVLNEPLELDRFTARVTKCPENAMVVPEQFREEMALRFEHQNSIATLFGTNIQVGPTRIQIDRAEIVELSATMKRFSEAKIGTEVPISFRPLVPVRFERLARDK